MTSRLTPRKKETNVGIKALHNGIAEAFEAANFRTARLPKKYREKQNIVKLMSISKIQ